MSFLPVAELKNALTAKLAGEPLEVLPPGGSHWLGFED
jgi:hypothetical protein